MPSFESARRRITSTLGHLSLGRRSEDTPSETPSQTTAARSRTKGALDFFRFRKDPEASTSQEPTAETNAPETSAAPPKKKRWLRFKKLSGPRSETRSNAGLTEIVSTDAPPLSTITEDAIKKGKKAIRTENDYESESDSESVKDLKTTKVTLDQVRLDTSEDINRWTDRARAVVEGHQAWLQRHTPIKASSPTELPNLRQMQETTLETIGEAHEYMRLHLLNQHRSLIDTNQILADLQGIKPPDITVNDQVALPDSAHEAKERIERLTDVITLHQTYNQLEKVRIAYSKYNPTGTLPIEGIEALHNQAMDLSRKLDELTSEFGLLETDFQRFSGMTADNIRETVNGELQNRDISHDEKRKIWLSAHVAILRKQSNRALDSIYNKLNKDIIDMRRDFFRWTNRKGSETRAGISKNAPEYRKLEDAIINAAGDIEPNINPDSNLTNEEKSTCFKDAIERVQYYDQTFDTFRQKRKDEGIEEEWVKEGINRTQNAQDNLRKRRERDGMTREVVEESYTAHYRHLVEPVSQDYWNLKRFGQMVENGMMRGEMKDWTFVGMEPKMPDGFDGVDFQGSLVLKALVSFHSDGRGGLYGSIVNINADLVDDNRWRDSHYKEYRQQLSPQLPEKYSEALHPSELTRKAYQLAFEEYKGDPNHELDPNTPLPPIREFIGFDIVFPGSREPLHGYGTPGQADTFTRGNQEGDKVVNLARCTHYGPRPEFLKLDDPGLVPGEIGSATIYRELNDKGEEHKMHLKFTMVEA